MIKNPTYTKYLIATLTILVSSSHFHSFAWAQEDVRLADGRIIEVHPDGTWIYEAESFEADRSEVSVLADVLMIRLEGITAGRPEEEQGPTVHLDLQSLSDSRIIQIKTHYTHCNQYTENCYSVPSGITITDSFENEYDLTAVWIEPAQSGKTELRPGESVDMRIKLSSLPLASSSFLVLKFDSAVFDNEQTISLQIPTPLFFEPKAHPPKESLKDRVQKLNEYFDTLR